MPKKKSQQDPWEDIPECMRRGEAGRRRVCGCHKVLDRFALWVYNGSRNDVPTLAVTRVGNNYVQGVALTGKPPGCR